MLSGNIALLERLGRKFYFSTLDLANILGVGRASAKVLASRYAHKGVFVRLKKDFYILNQNWRNFRTEDFFKIANVLQVPSYVSFMTALGFYDVTTQVQQGFFESAAQKRTIKFDIRETVFSYYKLKREFYFDFVKQGDFFIATREKAFVDAFYLRSIGKYQIDISSLDIAKLDIKRVRKLMRSYPQKTRRMISEICKI